MSELTTATTTSSVAPGRAFPSPAALGADSGVTIVPNARGGNTYGINDVHGSFIPTFTTSKDLIDMRVALAKAGVNVLNFKETDPASVKNPGDGFVSYIAGNQASYIVVLGQSNKLGVTVTVNGFVRLGDIVDSGWD
ncbi:hypothetical protein SAMN04487857_10284 [Pseudomonas sp. ok272]|uniref:hypothetical protein n=1 Tax=unclassified Pseudomonas TaxID=196821 RepID=UPI0008B16B60|nr:MULTISPECIES: hypothetical protein [unclassified Pseudomonas]SEM45608.1 hypothetical protein SAMN04487857_10284 [Pseudomonas sp. ok272]SFM17357.1 hypothetical protein SAMN04487858_10185 [Pseudomonas sp. ok602]